MTDNIQAELIARLIEPRGWRALDAAIKPFVENRGAVDGEQHWHEWVYRNGCRSGDEARRYMLEEPLHWREITIDIMALRESVEKAQAILDVLSATKDASHTAELEALRERAAMVAMGHWSANNGEPYLKFWNAAVRLVAQDIRALPLTEKEAG